MEHVNHPLSQRLVPFVIESDVSGISTISGLAWKIEFHFFEFGGGFDALSAFLGIKSKIWSRFLLFELNLGSFCFSKTI